MISVKETSAIHRFYLLFVLKADQEVDMDRLRRLSISIVWGTEFILIPLCQLPWYLIVKDYGWPERSILDILLSDEIVALKAVTATVIMSNLPDYLSIALYASMIWHQFNKSNSVDPTDDVENVEEEGQFGGIWVGGSLSDRLPERLPSTDMPLNWREMEIRSPPPPPPSSPLPCFQQPAPSHPFPLEDENNDDDSQCYHKWSCVMPVLRWHVALSLFDVVATGVNVLFCQGELGKMITYLVQVCFCYWTSLVMITKNYRQLGSIRQYVLSKMC